MNATGVALEPGAPLAEDRRTGGYQLSPLFDWTDADVHAYIAEHALLVHPLHAAGFPSIGCAPCTTAVQPGEDARAGRWRHLRGLGKTEMIEVLRTLPMSVAELLDDWFETDPLKGAVAARGIRGLMQGPRGGG